MAIDYGEFIEYVRGREFNNYRDYISVIKSIEEFYNVDDIKFFYPKNLFNEKQTELIFFLKEGYLTVAHNEDTSEYSYEHIYCKVKSKTLTNSGHVTSNHRLSVMFDNGKEVIFDNQQDSNSYWQDSYATSIRELFKMI